MLTTLFSFLGGAVFRMLWGEISAWLTKAQEHSQELARLQLQEQISAAQHERNLAALRLQADLKVQVVKAESIAAVGAIEADAWRVAVDSIGRASGIWLVDLWNGIIRPLLATVCVALWVLHVAKHGWVLDEQGWQILGATLGLYLADRSLAKRGK